MPASSQGQLFEPFFTTDSKGTGLGLYIARELCDANRATLEYVRRRRRARISAIVAAQARQAMKRPKRRGAGRGPQVLVVDDEPDIRELLELTLLKMGLDVTSAPSIAEAKERLKGERFDLCLTDMRLPDGEGLELVRHIAQHARDLPVAVITAYGSAENAVAALKAGAFDYSRKPVGLEQLRALVRSALTLPDRRARRRRRPAAARRQRAARAGARADRQARAHARRRCTSPANRAAARSSPRA